MLLNNLDPEVAEHPESLVVYGGSGRAARSHDGAAWDRASAAPARRRRDAPRAVGQAGRRVPDASRRAARPHRELAARPGVGVVGRVPEARGGGPDDVRPDDRRVVDLHRHAGDPPGHVPDVLRGGRERTSARPTSRAGRSSPPGSAGWAARSRSPRRWRAPRSCASRSTSGRSIVASRRGTWTSRRRRSTRRSTRIRGAAAERRPLSVALRANAADVFPELVARGVDLRPRDRPDRRARPADGLHPGRGAVRGGRGAPRARSRRSTYASPRSRSSHTSARWSSSSGWGATFSTMATTCEVRPIERG